MTPWLAPLVIGTIAGVSPSPFAPGAVISYQIGQSIVLEEPYNPSAAIYRHAGIPPKRVPPMDPATLSGEGQIDEPEQPDLACGDHCVLPPEVSNWHDVFQIRYGVEFRGVQGYDLSSSAGWRELVNLLEGDLQYIHAMYLREVGVDLKVERVNFVDELPSLSDAAENDATHAMWSTFSLAHPIEGVMRVYAYPNGQTNITGFDYTNPAIGNAAWYPDHSLPINKRLRSLAHELGHQVFQLVHTQCYFAEGSSVPVAQCPGAYCWTGQPVVCPSRAAFDFMNYCAPTYCPGSAEWAADYTWPTLRLGPALSNAARNNILYYAALGKFGAPVAQLPWGAWVVDTDGDEVPDAFDNCPKVKNVDQADADVDGRGNVCDSCSIGYSKGGWWLLIFPIVILWRKR